MRTVLPLAALAVVLALPGRGSALWSVALVTPERARQLGVEVRATPGGPGRVTVAVEFPSEGELKGFSRVDLRIGAANNPAFTAPLAEDRSKPGKVVVTFAADPAKLDELAVWVYIPGTLGGSIYQIRPADFVAPRPRR